KMWEESFGWNSLEEHHPNNKVIVSITEKVPLLFEERSIPALITIRGNQHPLNLSVVSQKEGEKIKITGETPLSLQNLQIPDPSIFIASVKDTVDLTFQIILSAENFP